MPLPSPVISREYEVLDPKFIQRRVGDLHADAPGDPKDGEAYRVGPGDTLLIAVYNHPELSLATYAGSSVSVSSAAIGVTGQRGGGYVVDNDGTMQFPLLGTVATAGKTSAQLRVYLEQELARYVKDPKVTVQVVLTGSIRYYLLGQFTQPGIKFSDRPMRLLEALSLGGSIMTDKASFRGAYVARGTKRLPVNFRRLVREGDLSQNIKLHSGDIIFVPDNTTEQAFVFAGTGGTNNPRGGSVQFVNGKLDIVQALASAGYGFRDRALGRLSKVRVIRGDSDRGEFITVNVAKILKGKAAPFALIPGDVVYVPATGIANWNLVLDQLLPTLQTVAGVLNPFVQIKYLSDSTGGGL
jgi:polysaccharide export outer membrane protein